MGETGTKAKTLLFLPFYLIILLHVAQIYLAYTTSYKIPSHFERGFFLYLDYCSFAFNFTIVFIVYKKIRTFKRQMDSTGTENKIKTDWLIRLLYIGFFICIAWLIALSITFYLNHQNKYFFYALWLSISFLVYWLGYAAIYQLNIYRERKDISFKQRNKVQNIGPIPNRSPIIDKFQHLIREKELYMNPELKQSNVAEMMGITSNHLSKVLNEFKSISFNDLINELRIEKAKEFLLDEEFDRYTHTAIGLESGFNSKSTFFKAFKKHTGTTPSDFKKSYIEISPKF
ncbi:helix-turn-helix domain-containing protein [Pricia sp.]|uniref:helix-turn-helix domain-containing protein n=1 Tax=Pricia sp. TaxID=2268138 RepID=UPI0035943461